MQKPEDIPELFVPRWVPEVHVGDYQAGMARAILAERERCERIADEIAAGRKRQSSEAKAAKKRVEARDFESMAISAIQVASAIRSPS